MIFNYNIKYKSKNTYENPVFEANWQFLITPENNETQKVLKSNFNTSVNARIETSVNGLGFNASRIHCKNPFDYIEFSAEFKLQKKEINPFDFLPSSDLAADYELLNSLHFKVDYISYLINTPLTQLLNNNQSIYIFDHQKTIFDNLLELNQWIHNFITFTTGVTHVNTLLSDILKNKEGVCQDYSHLFCAIGRKNNVPTRYVSGYLHQGNGFLGDSQMHAWVEAYVPYAGWIGFDPTNNILANHNHIKVAHGKDYSDCSPIKGVLYSTGKNYTEYTVEVAYKQKQQQQ